MAVVLRSANATCGDLYGLRTRYVSLLVLLLGWAVELWGYKRGEGVQMNQVRFSYFLPAHRASRPDRCSLACREMRS